MVQRRSHVKTEALRLELGKAEVARKEDGSKRLDNLADHLA
jgi:hypothetical protein